MSGFAVDEDVRDKSGEPRPFHIRITAPAAAEKYAAVIRGIAVREKPAHVTFDLVFVD